MSQEEIIAEYTTLATTGCDTLTSTLLTYHTALGINLFGCATVDQTGRTQLQAVDKAHLMLLRNRIDAFYGTLRQAISAGSN